MAKSSAVHSGRKATKDVEFMWMRSVEAELKRAATKKLDSELLHEILTRHPVYEKDFVIDYSNIFRRCDIDLQATMTITATGTGATLLMELHERMRNPERGLAY